MPRIRTVKPEVWTDSKVVALSPLARLLFIGSWNFADDYGCLPADAMQLKLRVLPADQGDAHELVAQLLKSGLLEALEDSGGVEFWHVSHWDRHQRVSHPSDSDFGDPSTWRKPTTRVNTELTVDLVTIPEDSGEFLGEGKGTEGKEGKGKELAPKPARDRVWDTLAEIFGEPTTRTNRGLRGKLVKSLSNADATPAEIRTRVQAWPLHFPDATLTETALEKHWDRLARPPARASKADVERYETEMRMAEGELRARRLDGGLPA